MSTIRKNFDIEIADNGWVTVSTPVLDRDRDRVMPLGLDLTAYEKNPVLLWAHDYRSPHSIIGKAEEMRLDQQGFHLKPVLREPVNEHDPMVIVKALWDQKLVRAFSIGFNPTEFEENEEGGMNYTRAEILEVSAVPVPANQEAVRSVAKMMGLVEDTVDGAIDNIRLPYEALGLSGSGQLWSWGGTQYGDSNSISSTQYGDSNSISWEKSWPITLDGFTWIESKGAVRYNAYPPADENRPWSGSGARKRLKEWAGGSMSKYGRGFSVIDGDTENYGSYKGPHHDIIDGKIMTVWRGVRAAMGSLVFGARGGRISDDSTRRAVYNHLKKHYGQFDKEAPDYKEYTDAELKELFEDDDDDTEAHTDAEPGIADNNELTPEQESELLGAVLEYMEVISQEAQHG
jgi:HK97 family phage prohead protease